MKRIKRMWARVKRFRNRKGYGVHSPFAFNFITGVIYERGTYYAYKSLKADHPWAHYTNLLYLHEQQCARLLFRLVNYTHPNVIVSCDLPYWQRNYIKAASKNAIHLHWPLQQQDMQDEKTEKEQKIDWFYGNTNAMTTQQLDNLLVRMHCDSMMVLKNIRSNKKSSNMWVAVQNDRRVGVTFDLYDYGIVFFDTKKHKQHYIVNF